MVFGFGHLNKDIRFWFSFFIFFENIDKRFMESQFFEDSTYRVKF